MLTYEKVNLDWLGHASFKIKTEKIVIYIDPYQIKESSEKADIILITHDHYDHCSPEDVKKIRGEKTVVFAAKGCKEKLDVDAEMEPGQREEVHDVVIDAVPAYNIGKKFHPKEKKGVGYIVDVLGVRIYHAGDTDLIPEMDKIRADIALLPVGGTYTMDADEAAEAAERIGCEIAVPMHYGSIIGGKEDAEHFRDVCSRKVEIL